jgi:ABC-type lipoprotein export system ATPase subunit
VCIRETNESEPIDDASLRILMSLTIVLVTHEHDIAQFAKRVLVFRDGKIRKDDPVLSRPKAREVLKTLPTIED